jgi:hypothetical protein
MFLIGGDLGRVVAFLIKMQFMFCLCEPLVCAIIIIENLSRRFYNADY